MDNLVDGDRSEGNNCIGSGLLVHDLDKELGLACKRDAKGLVPSRGLAGILVDKGLLERLWVVEIESELEVGVLLAERLQHDWSAGQFRVLFLQRMRCCRVRDKGLFDSAAYLDIQQVLGAVGDDDEGGTLAWLGNHF